METANNMDRFVQEEVEAMAPLFAERFQQLAEKKGVRATGALINSMVSKAVGSKEIQAEFAQHGRFQDMGAGRGWRKGTYVGQGKPGRAPKKKLFYSKPKYGLFGQLTSNLSNKYFDGLYDQAVNELIQKADVS